MALVFDIGMHNGDDTAYYLARGFEVVAVEANPLFCELARARFASEIGAGRLTVRNVGIAESAGELEFWISDVSQWSSFHRENATKGGAGATSTRVPTIPFLQLIEESGTPFFAKIDIEMNDTLCLADLAKTVARPAYLSIEWHPKADDDIELLASLGYRAFKCIRQNDLREIGPGNVAWHCAVRTALTRGRLPGKVRGAISRLHYRRQRVKGWTFPEGASGPLGYELPGPWLARDEMLSVWHRLIALDLALGEQGLGEWYDIHAALEGHSPG